MSGLSPFVAFRYYRAAPLAVGIGPLPSGAVSAGVWIVSAACATAAGRSAGSHCPRVSSSSRVVSGAARDPAVRTIRAAGITIGSVVRIVVRTHTVGYRVGAIDRISVRRAIVIGRIVVAASVSDRCPYSESNDKYTKIAGGAA